MALTQFRKFLVSKHMHPSRRKGTIKHTPKTVTSEQLKSSDGSPGLPMDTEHKCHYIALTELRKSRINLDSLRATIKFNLY